MVDFKAALERMRSGRDLAPAASPPQPQLSPSQARALAALRAGKSVFLTGVAGTGKSFVVRRWLEDPGQGLMGQRKVSVTATTGIAAVNVNGQTIHRWAGIGKGDEPLSKIVNSPSWRDWKATRIWRADAVLVDEVSMASAKLLDLVDAVCREARFKPDLPFGGLQVVFCGDLGQLPPVDEQEGFCFESKPWRQLEEAGQLEVCELTEPQRQSDAWFVGLLNRARMGTLSGEDEQLLLSRRVAPPEDVKPVFLVTKNAQAEEKNSSELLALPAETERVYEAECWGKAQHLADQLAKNCPSPDRLRLREGARVMVTRNDQGGVFGVRWVNGSLGTVERMTESSVFVRLDRALAPDPLSADPELVELGFEVWETREQKPNGETETVAFFRQIPLRLAYAITVHKSQGATIDAAVVDLSETFADGQAYVALSRVRSLDGLFLAGWCGRRKVTMPPKVRTWLMSRGSLGSLLEGLV